MTATATWYERNGASGSTTNTSVSNCDWKSTDDASASRINYPVTAGNNSYHKYNYVAFTGAFNQISNVKVAHTSGTLGTGISLKGKTTNTYATPATSALGSATDMTSPTTISSGLSVKLGTSDPTYATNNTLSSAGYTAFIITQVQTTSSATAGDSGTATLTLQYDEN